MKILTFGFLLLSCSFWSGFARGQVVSKESTDREGRSRSTPVRANTAHQRGVMSRAVAGQRLRYVVVGPTAKPPTDAGYPILLFLHGAGERGRDLDRVSFHGPLKVLSTDHEEVHPLRQAYVIAPQCPSDQWWQSETLAQLITEVMATIPLKVDARRIYVSGLSMGGFGVWKLITDYPDLFAAAVPVCGGYDVSKIRTPLGLADARQFSFDFQEIERAKGVPVWATHGAKDRIVSPMQTRELVAHLKQSGNKRVRWIEYPGVGHDSWSRTYNDPQLYQWLFEQMRQTPAKF